MGSPSRDQGQRSVQVHQEGGTIVIAVGGHLDGEAGAEVLEAATAAVGSRGAQRLDVDLRDLESFDTDGADALVACRALGGRLVDGLHYRTGRGAGRSALLSAYRAADTGEMRAITTREADGTA
jgi:hypothetical protein